jgi:hypothetical protein
LKGIDATGLVLGGVKDFDLNYIGSRSHIWTYKVVYIHTYRFMCIYIHTQICKDNICKAVMQNHLRL